MSDIEQRLRSALEARAALVQPEDLKLNPVLEPTEPETGPWWQRPGAYLFVAAVAVIVIALPLLALAATVDRDGDRDPDQFSTTPTDPPTMTDPVPMEVDKGAADVDGDGTDDPVRVVELEVVGSRPRHGVEVDLSSTGETVSYRYPRLGTLELAESADVDGRPGREIFAVLEAPSQEPRDLHRSGPSVISLRDGELTEILAEDFDTGYWWVGEGSRLWWWQSEDDWPAGAATIGPVEATSFRPGDRLQPTSEGSYCVDLTVPDDLRQCGGGEPPSSTDTGDPNGEPPADLWWEQHPEGLPSTWGLEGEFAGSFTADIDGDGSAGDTASIAGSEVRVDTGGSVLTAPIDGGDPVLEGVVRLGGLSTPVVVGHTSEGAAGTTYVTWFAYAVVGGELVELTTAPLGPKFLSQYSNLSTDEGGHPTVRTWLAGDNALHGMDYLDRRLVEGPDDTEVWAYQVRVRSWYVDGTTLRATVPVQTCVAPDVGREFYECPDGL